MLIHRESRKVSRGKIKDVKLCTYHDDYPFYTQSVLEMNFSSYIFVFVYLYSFSAGGLSPKFLIIDDGWQETVNEYRKEGEPDIEGIQ